ncbi:hypothetical protein ASG92_24345 [Arthrobacter sp. Soil736]|uniref:hypothetical protein n=1 Tax=Arthrobacter sp. Soil736 TaxID=1736395 RepID=UPI0006F80858|nr:hypothetical protein [Arthrobacter sp. Soil736]KRE54829.1 hypothetical protein ASG92_24345 [Arthrobacter sp. Soil736]
MKSKSFKKAGVISASVLVLGLAGVTLASANPATAGRPYAAVGSDTTQDVWNGLTNAGPLKAVASYDAFGEPATITLETGKQLSRPAGSGAGVKALSAAHNAANHVYKDSAGNAFTLAPEDIAIARSSSSPSVAGNDLTFLPFARDAVSVAYLDSAGTTPLDLTTEQIKNIFTCTAGAGVTIDAAGKPVINGITLTPKLPQASSGTRSFFLKAAGITVSTSCIPAGNQTSAENNGAALVGEGDIIPFSAAQWIAQKNGATSNTTAAGQHLADVDGLKAVDPASTGTSLKPGTLFGNPALVPASAVGTFARDTFNVVPTAIQTSTTGRDAILRNTVTSLLKTTASKSIISRFGFKNIEYAGDWTKGKPSGYTN